MGNRNRSARHSDNGINVCTAWNSCNTNVEIGVRLKTTEMIENENCYPSLIPLIHNIVCGATVSHIKFVKVHADWPANPFKIDLLSRPDFDTE